ncbi:acyl-CoA dehydrogenase C-terminal domain-containing protein [Cohaesibacter gelatinilyticus]|uniref:3-methylmercaptopropionyl-CoA dehydrogenase n=1 Tax=Cohaesibacter gelatinilyticus TaxID=372072 RepID=A0A285N6I0_9HYPH|nr:acyl-CoA dehydrogenase C-terminal domain-containing protein [Cohaesibacter gelatinilyticus]SNZ05029.1 Acyl-CoA dehydrogenase [Cohaesibacter gelatinilyticus]
MQVYKAPVEESLFLLKDLFGLEQLTSLPGYEEATEDLVEAILREGAKFCEEVLTPLNEPGDSKGCSRADNGSVLTPPGFKEAYQTYAQGGWMGLSGDVAYGGQGMPSTLSVIINEYMGSANLSFSMYSGLTQGAFAALSVHANDKIKARFLPKMMSGEWTGTMNLTEAHCGTDLGLLRTKAVPQDDGSYKITGTKIFISAGDHDMAENIIHLVLARIEGAPEGTKGISLFVVPKFIPDSDNNPDEANSLECGKIEEKMGIHGNATCVMNFDGATGWLVGAENQGLKAMFVMMNEARLGVAVQGLTQSEAAYQNARDYALDRLQGRALTGAKNPDGPADPLIVHPDVRRMLLTIRSFNEAARAFAIYTSIQSDIAHKSEDEKARQAAADKLALFTPVLKGVLTDCGFENAVLAQQVFGGHGFIEETGISQYVRDARITMIYEGANGIQALDLVGRKLMANGGRGIMGLFQELGGYIQERAEKEDLAPFILPLKRGAEDLQKATMWFGENALGNPDHAGAGSVDYMHLFGHVMLGYMWAQMAEIALTNKDENRKDFFETKLTLASFFMERVMPQTTMRLKRIQAGADVTMAMSAEAF